MNKNKEILNVLEEKHEIELGKCPYCNSTNYARNSDLQDDLLIVNCDCNDCGKVFREYFELNEVIFNENNEEHIYNKSLDFHDKKTLLKAMNLLIKLENNTIDHTRIINILKDKLNKEIIDCYENE